MKKVFNKIFLVITLFFISLCSIDTINASFASSYSNIKQGTTMIKPSGNPGMHIKYSADNNMALVCTKYNLATPAGSNTTCTLTNNWSNATRAGVAAILNATALTSANTAENEKNYYCTELSINQFLATVGEGGYSFGESYDRYISNAACPDYLNPALDAYNRVKTPNTISLSASELTFTKSSDGYYYSNPVTVNLNNLAVISNISLSDPKFSYKRDGNVITVKVKSSDIDLATVQPVTLTVSSSRTYYVAREYYCGAAYQTVTPDHIEVYTENAVSAQVSGRVEKSAAKFKVAKVNEKGVPIAGATLMIQTEDMRKNGKQGLIISSGTNYTTIEVGSVGKYYLTEVTAPPGYIKSNDVVEIVVTNNEGGLTVNGVISSGTVNFSNKLIKTQFSKVDITTNEELPGATLQILDLNKKIVKDKNGQPYQWVSGTEPKIIEGLPAGTYYLKETIAPAGYTLSELVKFVVKDDGTVTKVVMKNKFTKTQFSKIDVTTGKELPGATLQILDSNKNLLNDKNGIPYEWVSTDEPKIIEGLPAGTYYLKEVIAPEGYTRTEELVKFEVKNDGTVTMVEMKNSPIVPVENTASNISIPMLIIGTLLLGVAGFVIMYVMKRRKNLV